MNKKFLILLTTLLCASFYGNVGATQLEPKDEKTYTNKPTQVTQVSETFQQQQSNFQTKSMDENYSPASPVINELKNKEKGYIIYFGLNINNPKDDVEIKFYLSLLFKALELEIKSKYPGIEFKENFIKDVKIEYLIFPDCPIQIPRVSFKVVTDNILTPDGKFFNFFDDFLQLSEKIGKFREHFKEIAEKHYKEINNTEFTKIKDECTKEILTEIKRLENLKNKINKKSDLPGKTINETYNLCKFDEIFDRYISIGDLLFNKNLNKKRKDFTIDIIDNEIKNLSEKINHINQSILNDDLLNSIKEAVDLIQNPTIDDYENSINTLIPTPIPTENNNEELKNTLKNILYSDPSIITNILTANPNIITDIMRDNPSIS